MLKRYYYFFSDEGTYYDFINKINIVMRNFFSIFLSRQHNEGQNNIMFSLLITLRNPIV